MFKVQENTKNKNPKILGTGNGETMILSNCAICGTENSKINKKQEGNALLSSLRIKTPLSKIP